MSRRRRPQRDLSDYNRGENRVRRNCRKGTSGHADVDLSSEQGEDERCNRDLERSDKPTRHLGLDFPAGH